MSQSSNRIIKELAIIVIAGGILTTFGIYLSRKPTTVSPTNDSVPAVIDTKTEDSKPEPETKTNAGSLIGLRVVDNAKQLVSISINDSKATILYTDKDEASKLIALLGIFDKKAIAIQTKDQAKDKGELVSIALDGSGKKTSLQKEVTASPTPKIDPKSGKLLTIQFSPVERDFGYTLTLQEQNGSNKRVIAKNIPSYVDSTFSSDGKYLYYVGIKDKTSQIVQIQSDGTKVKDTFIDGIAVNLSKIQTGLLIGLIPDLQSDSNDTKLTELDDSFKTVKTKIKDSNGQETNIVPISQTLIALKRSVFSANGLNSKENDNIFLIDITTGEEKALGTASYIAGFTNE